MDAIGHWVFTAELEEIPKGKQRCFTVGSRSVILCRIYADVYAVKNECPHLKNSAASYRVL